MKNFNLLMIQTLIILANVFSFDFAEIANTTAPSLTILFVTGHVGTSHKKSVMPLAEYLAHVGGHNVTVFSSFYSNPPITSDHVTSVDLDVWTEDQDVMDQYVHGNASGGGLNAWSITNSRNIEVQHLFEMSNDICRRTMDQHPDVFQRLLDTPWDIIMVDSTVAHCAFVISTIGMSSKRSTSRLLLSTLTPFHYTQRHIGIPTTISDNYSWLAGYDYRSFWHRLEQSFWFQLFDYYFSYYISHRIQVTLFDTNNNNCKSSLIKAYFEKSKSLINGSKFSMWEFDKNSSFTFYQYPDEFGVYRPHLQTDIPIGGLKCIDRKDVESLPQQYQAFVSEKTSKGTILLALGHYVNWDDIPDHIPLAFYNAFQQFPDYRFIWQYLGNPRSLVNTTNILIVDWLPQLQILHHNKTRILISQVGLKSAAEAICTSVPILALPTWGDQPLTARLLTNHHQAGKLLDRNLLSRDYIANSIREALANRVKHKTKLDKLRNRIFDKPIKSDRLAQFWIEYSVRNRNHIKILIARGRYLGFPVYYCLDVVSLSLLGVCVIIRIISSFVSTIVWV